MTQAELDALKAFLEVFGRPTPAELLLWSKVLSRVKGSSELAFIEWLSANTRKPKPQKIVALMVAQAPDSAMTSIAHRVAALHGVTVDLLRGKNRTKKHVIPRHEAIHAMRAAGFSSGMVGRFFDLDHSSINHACAAHAKRLCQQPDATSP